MSAPAQGAKKNPTRFWAKAKKYIVPYGLTRIQAQRILKGSLTTTICFVLCLIDPVFDKLGVSAQLAPILSVSMHGGRRLGAMIQAFYLSLIGLGIAIPYAVFTHFVAQKLEKNGGSTEAALGLLSVFEVIMLSIVGYTRSVSPQLFPVMFLFFLVVHFSYLAYGHSLGSIAYQFSVPVLLCMGVSFAINIFVFPEFGSTYIGGSVTNALHEVHVCLNSATNFFTSAERKSAEAMQSELAKVVGLRKKVRDVISQCQAVLVECTYEVSISFMAPQEVKEVVKLMQQLNVTESALVVACELEFAVFSSLNSVVSREISAPKDLIPPEIVRKKKARSIIDDVKPEKEVSYADKEVLLTFLETVRAPVMTLQLAMSESLTQAKRTIARSYDVSESKVPVADLPDDFDIAANEEDSQDTPDLKKSDAKKELTVESLEEQLAILLKAIYLFDIIVKDALSKISDDELDVTYIMPRDEYFLLSSFLLNFRESAIIVSKILENAHQLLQTRLKREAKGWTGRKLWLSDIGTSNKWLKFLGTGWSHEVHDAHGASIAEKQSLFEDENAKDPNVARRTLYTNTSEDSMTGFEKALFKTRTRLADFLDSLGKRKAHFKSMVQTVLVMMLISFPMFSVNMRMWYVNMRGSWVGFVAMLALDTSVGASVYSLIARAILLLLGSSWGYALFAAGGMGKNRYVMCVLFALAMPPFWYMLLVSPYAKSGTFSIVSCVLVPLVVIRPTGIFDTILESWGKRIIALLIGGTTAVIVQATIFPKKARVLLSVELINTLKNLQRVQEQLALGLNGESLSNSFIVRSETEYVQYSNKAKASLALAEAYLDVTRQEPRLKGSFKQIQAIYKEMFFVIHQILDRFDTIRFLRQQYGSAVLEDLSSHIYTYRREVYGSLISLMRAVEQALETKKPLPQFLPSARIAHLRVINAVRALLIGDVQLEGDLDEPEEPDYFNFKTKRKSVPEKAHRMLRRQFMSWSATSSAVEEVIEYVEGKAAS